MSKIKAILAGAFAGLALAATTVPAQASNNYGTVIDDVGAAVPIDCSLGATPHQDHLLYERSTGKKYKSSQFSDCSDADAFHIRYDKRCIALYLVGQPSVLVKAEPDHWFKLPGASTARIQDYKGCSGAPWVSSYLTRLK